MDKTSDRQIYTKHFPEDTLLNSTIENHMLEQLRSGKLRSGMCKLNKYLARIGAIEADTCSCGREPESVYHFLFRCPLWFDQRQNICRLASKPKRWGDLSFELGG